jgi:hypothetical protein
MKQRDTSKIMAQGFLRKYHPNPPLRCDNGSERCEEYSDKKGFIFRFESMSRRERRIGIARLARNAPGEWRVALVTARGHPGNHDPHSAAAAGRQIHLDKGKFVEG